DTAAFHLANVLTEIANCRAAIDRDLPFIGLFLAGDHAEQRGLAGAIGADQADLFALLQHRRRLDKDNLLAVLLADAFETDHGNLRAGAGPLARRKRRRSEERRVGKEWRARGPPVHYRTATQQCQPGN